MELIQDAETKPLSDDDLVQMLGPDAKRCRVMLYDDLANYSSLHELLPNRDDAAIILLQIEAPNAPKVGHWIALLNHGDHYEHFDSYGLDPDEELHITHEEPYITRIINNTRWRVESTQVKLQLKREAVNTCGRWCVVRVRFPHLERREFVRFIQQVHPIPDVAVTLLTYLLHK